MAVLGNPDAWSDFFPAALIPNVLDVIIASWASFPRPQHSEREVRITRRFRAHLRKGKNARLLPVRIERESPEDDEGGQELGRIDLRFTHGHREEIYFAFECKRLSLLTLRGRRSLAGDYIKDGMMRFGRSIGP